MIKQFKAKPFTNEKKMREPEYAQYRISADEFLPLELSKDLHICLWSEDETFKWTIAYFDKTKDGPFIRSVGERILDDRVDYKHFKALLKLGFAIAWHNFDAAEMKD